MHFFYYTENREDYGLVSVITPKRYPRHNHNTLILVVITL